MYYDFTVPIPDVKGKITFMKKGKITYVQLEIDRKRKVMGRRACF